MSTKWPRMILSTSLARTVVRHPTSGIRHTNSSKTPDQWYDTRTVARHPNRGTTPKLWYDTRTVVRHPTCGAIPKPWSDPRTVVRHPTGGATPKPWSDPRTVVRHPTGGTTHNSGTTLTHTARKTEALPLFTYLGWQPG